MTQSTKMSAFASYTALATNVSASCKWIGERVDMGALIRNAYDSSPSGRPCLLLDGLPNSAITQTHESKDNLINP